MGGGKERGKEVLPNISPKVYPLARQQDKFRLGVKKIHFLITSTLLGIALSSCSLRELKVSFSMCACSTCS